MAKCGLLAGCALLCLVVEVGAGAWTLPQKKLWGKVTHFQQTTNEWFVASPQFPLISVASRHLLVDIL